MTQENIYELDGNFLKQLLKRKKITHEEAARLSGMNKNTINKAANGGLITMENFLKICNLLETHPGKFFKSLSPLDDDDSYDTIYEKTYPLRRHPDVSYAAESQSSYGYEAISNNNNTSAISTSSIWSEISFDNSKDEELAILRRLNANYLKQIEELETKLTTFRNNVR